MTQQDKAAAFKAMHIAGDPVILYNGWDAGSIQTIADQGAKALALGSHGVANANGYEDGQQIPLELVLSNAQRCVDITDLPLSLDFETGYGNTPDEVKQSVSRALETGIIGVNIEDQITGGDGLYSIDEQVERLRAVRAAGNDSGVELFINARTDLFKNTPEAHHNDGLLDEALEKAKAFAEAGADGFFVPLMKNIDLIKRLCAESPLPVNIIYIEGMGIPAPTELAAAGASRISYGPGPYLKMVEWLKSDAKQALS